MEMGSCGISIRRNAGKPDTPNVVSSGDGLPCNWFRSGETARNMFIRSHRWGKVNIFSCACELIFPVVLRPSGAVHKFLVRIVTELTFWRRVLFIFFYFSTPVYKM